MKPTTRRDFIKHMALCCGASLLPGAWSPFAPGLSYAASCTTGPSSRKVLVSIFLSGGPDGKSILVPRVSTAYFDKHPTLAISNSLTLDSIHGLNPAMPKLYALYQQGKVALFNGMGYPNQSRSHEDSTTIMGRGIVNTNSSASGYAGRFANAFCSSSEAFSIFSFRGNIPEIRGAGFTAPTGSNLASFSYQSTGDTNNNNFLNLTSKANRNNSGLNTESFNSMYEAWQSGDASVGIVSQVAGAYTIDPSITYPSTDIGGRLKDAAMLINATSLTPVRQIFISQGGFDTHENQATTLTTLAGRLDAALDVFWRDMIRLGRAQDVVIIAFGEFGRTNENGTVGTDHGQGGFSFVLGNSVRGGVLSPAYQDSDFTNTTKPWVPIKLDYREALEQIYARHMNADPSAIFPEAYNKIGVNLFT